MSKIKVNSELLQLMDDYNLFMDSAKKIDTPLNVSKVKGNHRSSLYEEVDLISEENFGETSLVCEVRDKNKYNYSFQILTDSIKNRVISRFDEGNGTHKNNCDDIPLAEQMVTTPHFHRYDENGRFIAYKTYELKQLGTTPIKIADGFKSFCSHLNISCNNNIEPTIEVVEAGALPLEFDNDPLNGINF